MGQSSGCYHLHEKLNVSERVVFHLIGVMRVLLCQNQRHKEGDRGQFTNLLLSKASQVLGSLRNRIRRLDYESR